MQFQMAFGMEQMIYSLETKENRKSLIPAHTESNKVCGFVNISSYVL